MRELHPEYAQVLQTELTSDSTVVTEQPVFTKRELDSVFWVAQHGYVHSWNVLPPDTSMHDLIDELFPQLRISGGGVVDTLETGIRVAEIAHD